MTRTVGVEEELLLVDPGTRRATPRSPAVVRAAADLPGHEDGPVTEFYRHQVEIRTAPHTDLAELERDLHSGRSRTLRAAAEVGVAVAATGLSPLGADEEHVTDADRYRDMRERYGEIARGGGTCGMHVHVAVDDPEQGVRVIDAITPWLPVLVAITANSPFAHGRDTGYASWRSQAWSHWPSAGAGEPFGDLAGYRALSEALIATGAARDEGMLYFDARLSARFPTVEVRVCDTVTDPDLVALAAALVRGLVETAARRDPAAPPPPWRVEVLRAARWRAARAGLSGRLVHPATGALAPAQAVVEALIAHTAGALEDDGDLTLVRDLATRALAGTGASRQHAAHERGGDLTAVVDDLVTRFAATVD